MLQSNEQQDYFIVYKTINNVNKKIYVGQHKTKIVEDGYVGSGTRLSAAINKYGIENFTREILEYCDINNVNEREEYWIHFYNSTDKNIGYNLRSSAVGGHILNEEVKQLISEKTREAMKNSGASEKIKQNHKNGKYKYPKLSEETKLKISKAQKGIKKPNSGQYLKGKQLSEETKQKIRDKRALQVITQKSIDKRKETISKWSEERRLEVNRKKSEGHKGKKISKEYVEKQKQSKQKELQLF